MSSLWPLLNLKGKSLDEGHLALSGRARIPLCSADILLDDRENWLGWDLGTKEMHLWEWTFRASWKG